MKYIRTKDGIYENGLYNLEPGCYTVGLVETIKQADTIEELCDYFVVNYQKTFKVEHNIIKHYEKLYIDNWHKKLIKRKWLSSLWCYLD